jgi:hypothetical protein
MAKVTGKDVISFFEDADLELAELVLSFGTKEVEARVEKRAAAGQRMAKARAGRGKGKRSAAPQAPAEEVNVASPVEGRARRAHAVAATSVESDTALA